VAGPPLFPPEVVVSVKALACELPSRLGVPLSRLHVPDIAAEVVSRGIVAEISGTTIWRWLSEDAIRPWRQRSWIFPRDPDFETKAARVLDLYGRTFEGKPLGKKDFVLSADEKTSIQARVRCHATLLGAPSRATRIEHEYERGGALQYLAAWDVHRARLFGRCEPKTGIAPFSRLVAQFMSTEPYASARRVFLVVDNGSSHRGKKAADRLAATWPNLVLVHVPGPRQLAQPGGDLLLRRPAQGPHPERLRRPCRCRAAAARLRATLRAERLAFRVALHQGRPGAAHEEAGRQARLPGRRLNTKGYVIEITVQSTSPDRSVTACRSRGGSAKTPSW
jgi:hypothetical protein